MKKLMILLTFLLIVVSGTSQTDYPKSITINGDTLVAFTPKQVTKMNIIFLELDECKELNESLSDENVLIIERNSISEKKNENLINQNETLDGIVKEEKKQVVILTEENKKQSKEIKLLKLSRTLFTLGGVILGSATTYFVTLLIN